MKICPFLSCFTKSSAEFALDPQQNNPIPGEIITINSSKEARKILKRYLAEIEQSTEMMHRPNLIITQIHSASEQQVEEGVKYRFKVELRDADTANSFNGMCYRYMFEWTGQEEKKVSRVIQIQKAKVVKAPAYFIDKIGWDNYF